MSDLSARFRAAFSLEQGDPAAMFFIARVLDDGLSEVRSDRWATSERSLAGLGEPLFRSAAPSQDNVVAWWAGALLHVTLQSGYVYTQVAAADEETALNTLGEIRERLPTPEPVARHDVPVAFWTYTPQGPIPSIRPIAVPEWDEIEANYAASTRTQLAAIMRGFRPSHGGQLILWHGEAGTGKTFALRALAWEWREWCQLHYIVDPDTFFGERADYLMSVLTQPDAMTMGLQMLRSFHGYLLTPDAKSIIGQGLSRFLNVVDGLIGQGLRVLVLVTTNEELRRLHPAVARPGRCAANIEFGPLGADEAAEWLRSRGIEAAPAGRRDLASLYARLEGLDPNEPHGTVGFGD